MTRRTLTPERERELQTPIAKAFDNYFDEAYTPDSQIASVGSGIDVTNGDKDSCLMFMAFRVPASARYAVRKFMELQAVQFGQIIDVANNDDYDRPA